MDIEHHYKLMLLDKHIFAGTKTPKNYPLSTSINHYQPRLIDVAGFYCKHQQIASLHHDVEKRLLRRNARDVGASSVIFGVLFGTWVGLKIEGKRPYIPVE